MKYTLGSPQNQFLSPPNQGGFRLPFRPLQEQNLLLNTNQLSTSPIRVKGDFNLGAPNTAKLWGQFENHLLHSLNISKINTPVQMQKSTSKLEAFIEKQESSFKSRERSSHLNSSLDKIFTRRKSQTQTKTTKRQASIPSQESKRLSITNSLCKGTLDFRRSSLQPSNISEDVRYSLNPLLKSQPRIEQAPIPSIQTRRLRYTSTDLRLTENDPTTQGYSIEPCANTSYPCISASKPSLYQQTLLQQPLNRTMGDVYAALQPYPSTKSSIRLNVRSVEACSQHRRGRSYRSTVEDIIHVQQKALHYLDQRQLNEALILLQDYEKHVSYLCSPDQAIIKTLHLYLLGLCRFNLGIPGVVLLCDQALGLSERADRRSANYGSLTVALQVHLCFLRAKVFVKNGPADGEQLSKGIAALRHIIQEQMPLLRKARAKNIRGTAKNATLVKHLESFKEFDLNGAKSLYAEALMLSGRYDNAARVYQGLIKENEDILHDEGSISCLLNYYNQLGNCLSKQRKFEQSLKCYLKSRNIIRSYGLNVSAPIKAKILSNIATLYLNLDCGRQREAIELLQESLELKKRALEVNNSSLIQGYMMLGKGCLKLPQYNKACKSYKEALELAIFEGQPELTISIILDYSKALKGSGKSKEAVNLIESALEQGRSTTPIDTLFRAWQILLDLYLEMNSLSKAKILMRTIYAHLDSKKEELGSIGGISKLPDLYTKLAHAFKQNQEVQEALLVFLKAYSLYKGYKPIKRNPECERYLSLLQQLADCYVELCLYRQAEKYLNEALKILKQFAPNNNALLDSRCGAIFHKLGQVALKKDKTVYNRDNALFYFKQAEKCFTCTPWNQERRALLNEIKRQIVNIKLAKSLTLSIEQA